MHFSERWGYLSRAGLNDKSQFTRQIEKYADIYTSRVSNFLRYTVSDLHNVPINLPDLTAAALCGVHACNPSSMFYVCTTLINAPAELHVLPVAKPDAGA